MQKVHTILDKIGYTKTSKDREFMVLIVADLESSENWTLKNVKNQQKLLLQFDDDNNAEYSEYFIF